MNKCTHSYLYVKYSFSFTPHSTTWTNNMALFLLHNSIKYFIIAQILAITFRSLNE